ncbi:polysaccharide deacetylase family protein [Halomonas sp. LR5S13]|uniref:polysaccharide deacetylase family protein n=1 Tax=Halomonas rhizosphaerae TaxID=3043296 RepID=UPI0024A8F381|nr:polysaccharide deacetylase family protein [Halomonas rhizosphaerae]MDI5920856.1 polysaccharide deacetylase family protein [Halomonas rhizosphaerae]
MLRRRQGTLILYGHRIAGDDEGYLQGLREDWFAEQITYLARHYEFISLDTLVECLEQGKPPPHRSVVLTLDDGFRDNLETAFPILESYRIPATIFVVTRSLANGELPWSERLGTLLQRTREPRVAHPKLAEVCFPLGQPRQRREAYSRIKDSIAHLTRGERDAFLEDLAEQLEVSQPRNRMLTWEEARFLMSRGIDIGGHSYSHALLGRVSGREARHEIERCKSDLCRHLSLKAPHFCFPGGSQNDAVRQIVRSTGFRSFFRSSSGLRYNEPSSVTPFSMSRVGLPNAPAYHLEAELDSGFHPVRQWYHHVTAVGASAS